MDNTIVAIIIFIPFLLAIPAGVWSIWHIEKEACHKREIERAQVNTLTPTPEGNYPARITDSGRVIYIQPGNVIQPVAHNYSPKYTISQPAPAHGLDQPNNKLLTDPVRKPQLITAKEAISHIKPDSLSWCFGLDQDNQPITANIKDSVHVLNVGGTGQGKTTMTANLLAQLVLTNHANLYGLMIADLKGTISGPFKDYALSVTSEPKGYLDTLKAAVDLLEKRRVNNQFDNCVYVIVLEEALAIKQYLNPDQLSVYAQALDKIALVGREYNIFLLACSQIDYASKDFQNSRGQFMTRLAAATLPSAARSMGFTNTPIINKLWQDRKPGQFLLESPEGGRIITAPFLDLKSGELNQLLATNKPQISQNEATFEAKSIDPHDLRVYGLFKDGLTVTEIVKEVLGVSSSAGAKYQEASKQIQESLRKSLRG
jgi:hypothetical protein